MRSFNINKEALILVFCMFLASMTALGQTDQVRRRKTPPPVAPAKSAKPQTPAQPAKRPAKAAPKPAVKPSTNGGWGAKVQSTLEAPKLATTTVRSTKEKPVPAEEFSYAVGVAQSPSLRQYIEQREGVDSLHFVDFIEGLDGKFSETEISKMRAVIAGLNIAQQNKEQVIPAINNQATGNETDSYILVDVFLKGLAESLMDRASISLDAAMKISEQQFAYGTAIKNAKSSKSVKEQPVPAEEFSYAVGVAQGPSLRQYVEEREGVDALHFNDFLVGLYGFCSESDIAKYRAIVAGANIAKQNEEQVIPAINKQAVGSDSIAFLQKDLFVKGLVEGLMGKATLDTDSAMEVAEQQFSYQKEIIKSENVKYLAEYAKQPGVQKTESGLLYKVITQGIGALPVETSKVDVHYEGWFIDGTVFDSSYTRGKTAQFGVTQVIKGWTEALKMMPVGSTYEVCIPYDLAYGELGNRNIPPFATLIFKIELKGIVEQ